MLLLKEGKPKTRGRGLNWQLQKYKCKHMHMKIHVPTAEQCTFQEMGIFKGEKFSNLR